MLRLAGERKAVPREGGGAAAAKSLPRLLRMKHRTWATSGHPRGYHRGWRLGLRSRH